MTADRRTIQPSIQKLAGQPFQHGQHICAVYDTAEEQLAVAACYIADGLERDERCLYVAGSEEELDRLRARLRANGVDVEAAEAGSALLLRTSEQTHLEDGRFDAERMLKLLNDGIEQALDAGFTGLRTCGDMSWLLDAPPGVHQVIEYEAVLNQLFRNAHASGCVSTTARDSPRLWSPRPAWPRTRRWWSAGAIYPTRSTNRRPSSLDIVEGHPGSARDTNARMRTCGAVRGL